MQNTDTIMKKIKDSSFSECLADLYYDDPEMISYQTKRYINAVSKYEKYFGKDDVEIYSAPGRTEVGGNHTDHQHGQVLAASINLDAIAVVGSNTENTVEVISEGYSPFTIPLDNVEPREDESGTTTALIKGIITGMRNRGYHVGPFKAYITSDVLNGAGLSSSAAFEALIGTIFSGLFNGMKISPVDIAIIGQYAENVYFGKPCGLMDQMACSVGGFVHIDFKEPDNPVVEKVDFDISENGYSLCIVDTKGSHADLTDDYAMIPAEMRSVAALFGKEVLGEIDREDFYNKIFTLSGKVDSRAILRAMHFFDDNQRVVLETNALKENRFVDFLTLVQQSGNSSYKLLQNIYATKEATNQPMALALAISEHLLTDSGVCRVHGGGFAGTIQTFVKNSFVSEYKNNIEKIFGKDSCHILKIRKYGGKKVL